MLILAFGCLTLVRTRVQGKFEIKLRREKPVLQLIFFFETSVCTLDASLRLASIRAVEFRRVARRTENLICAFLPLPQGLQTSRRHHV